MSGHGDRSPFAFASPGEAIAAAMRELGRVESERVPIASAAGRVLVEALRADRDSPACDVSAMDGYAVRRADLSLGTLPVSGEAGPGRAPPAFVPGCATRIFTGGPVPAGCDAVIPREQLVEHPTAIVVPGDLPVSAGQHIRSQGQNASVGDAVVPPGSIVTPPVMAALSAFGVAFPHVYRRLRVGALVTGDEVRSVVDPVEPWQLRDSNGPSLAALLTPRPWIEWRAVRQARDDPDTLRQAVADGLAEVDALLLTGGVSMGDYDFVPATLQALGCRVVFHKLPIRPGKPILVAVGPGGQLVLALPGNPVSAMTTTRRFALPLLRHRAGFDRPDPPPVAVTLVNPDELRIKLWWSRPVRRVATGQAELLASQGSGDISAAARSDGFVEIPPNQGGQGPWPFHGWSDSDG